MSNTSKEQIVAGVIIFVLGGLIGGLAMYKKPLSSYKLYREEKDKVTWSDEVVATNLQIPWDMAELPDKRIIFTERVGKVRILNLETGEIKHVADIPTAIVSESGLTGVTLHPKFRTNHYLYLYYTYRGEGELKNKVVRYTFIDDKLTEDKVIVDGLAGGQIHNGGRLRFGPDGKLYVLTGDGARPALPQDMNSESGKVLRMNDDGSVPSDNPFPNSRIYTLGHRNPQGLAWHPLTEELFENEHGDTAHDELNLLKPGKNYGWAAVKEAISTNPRFTNPILESGTDTWAPSGLAFYGFSVWPLRNTALMAGLRSQQILQLEIVNGKVVKTQSLLKGKYGRLRGVTVLKDGTVLVSTSNRDGRAKPVEEDDRIIRLRPTRTYDTN